MAITKTAYKMNGKLAYYRENADYVVYENRSRMISAECLDPSYVAFIESEIKAGSNLQDARMAFAVECGER